MKKILLIICCLTVWNCSDSNLNLVTPLSEKLQKSIDFGSLEVEFGKPDLKNLFIEEDTSSGLGVIGILLEGRNNSKNVLIVTLKDDNIMEDKLFIGSLVSSDGNFNFNTDYLEQKGFEGYYRVYNVVKKSYSFEKNVLSYGYNVQLGGANDGSGICETVRCSSCSGDACTTDNVGNCTGYKFCSMGYFSAAACFASFPVCMIGLALDCENELCWDNETGNDYIY